MTQMDLLSNNSMKIPEKQTVFNAISEFVENEDNLRKLKNRVNILLTNEQRNKKKINQYEQKISKLQQVQNKKQEDMQKMGFRKKQRQIMIEQLKLKNNNMRRNHSENMEFIEGIYNNQKTKIYKDQCLKKKMFESTIFQNRNNSIQQKQQKRYQMIEKENKGRKNIQIFYNEKIKTIENKNMQEINELNRKSQKKDKQSIEITSAQINLLEKKQKSQSFCKELKKQIDSLNGKKQAQEKVYKKTGQIHPFNGKVQKILAKYSQYF